MRKGLKFREGIGKASIKKKSDPRKYLALPVHAFFNPKLLESA
jgi:hypothetical protein